MKKILIWLLFIIITNFLLYSSEQENIKGNLSSSEGKNSRSEFSISFEYEKFPQKYYSIDKQEKYEKGVWISYKTNQNEELRSYYIFSTKVTFLTPILSDILFTGIEIGFGFPINNYKKTSNIPNLTYDLDGMFSLPSFSSIEEHYTQRIATETKIYLIPLLLKLELRIPLINKLKMKTAFCLGSKLIYESTKTTIENSYQQDFYLYNKGDVTNTINFNNVFYIVPYGEGSFGLVFLMSPNISLGLNAKLGYLFNANFAKEETDLHQIDFWPADEKSSKLRSGNLYEGINIAIGFEIKINI